MGSSLPGAMQAGRTAGGSGACLAGSKDPAVALATFIPGPPGALASSGPAPSHPATSFFPDSLLHFAIRALSGLLHITRRKAHSTEQRANSNRCKTILYPAIPSGVRLLSLP